MDGCCCSPDPLRKPTLGLVDALHLPMESCNLVLLVPAAGALGAEATRGERIGRNVLARATERLRFAEIVLVVADAVRVGLAGAARKALAGGRVARSFAEGAGGATAMARAGGGGGERELCQ